MSIGLTHKFDASEGGDNVPVENNVNWVLGEITTEMDPNYHAPKKGEKRNSPVPCLDCGSW